MVINQIPVSYSTCRTTRAATVQVRELAASLVMTAGLDC